MSAAYENQRVVYNKILQKYKAYLNLYKEINNGSLQGASTFGDFYLYYTYFSRYAPGASTANKH